MNNQNQSGFSKRHFVRTPLATGEMKSELLPRMGWFDNVDRSDVQSLDWDNFQENLEPSDWRW